MYRRKTAGAGKPPGRKVLQMLDYKGFKEELLRLISRDYPDWMAEEETVSRMNGERDTFLLQKEQGGSFRMYVDDLYQVYAEGCRWEFVRQQIDGMFGLADTFYKAEELQDWEKIKDWEKMKGCVRPFVLNYERNRKFLTESRNVYQVCLDLAVAFYLELPVQEGAGSAGITEDLCRKWGVDRKELWEQCRRNTDYEIVPMSQVLGEISPEPPLGGEPDMGGMELLVFSNKGKYRGAAGLFFSDCIRERAEKKGCNYFILPSSVHELLLVKDCGDAGVAEQLKQIVCNINAMPNIISKSDYLSDSVYYYDREKDEVRIAG